MSINSNQTPTINRASARQDLGIPHDHDGFVFLAKPAMKLPTLRPHCHDEIELNVVTSGEVTYVVEDERYTFQAGTMLWMFPHQIHQLVDRSADASMYVAVFKPSLIKRSCRGDDGYRRLKGTRQAKRISHCLLDDLTFDKLRHTMNGIMDGGPEAEVLNREAGFGAESDFHYQHSDPDWLNAGLNYLLLLAWRIQRGKRRRQLAVPLHPSVAKAMRVMRQAGSTQSLPDLAKQCSVSPSYLSRMFRQQVGMPITKYRNSIRLAQFWEYYQRPVKCTLLEAVYQAGFGSYAQFFRIYSETYGCSPSKGVKLENLS